jgi:hypothetical protein
MYALRPFFRKSLVWVDFPGAVVQPCLGVFWACQHPGLAALKELEVRIKMSVVKLRQHFTYQLNERTIRCGMFDRGAARSCPKCIAIQTVRKMKVEVLRHIITKSP